jgi:drug/metabolite transporter (DMT)-like permease
VDSPEHPIPASATLPHRGTRYRTGSGEPASAQRLDRVGLVLCLVSAAGFGSLAIFGKQAYAGGLDVAGVLVMRFGLAAPLLVGLALVAGRRLRLPWPTALRLLGLGAVGYAIQATLFFTALTRISAGLAGLLLYLYPALVTAGAVALGRSRLERATVAGLALSLAGVVLVIGLPGERLDGLGVALGLASAGWYTVYILVGEYLLRGVDPLAASAWVTSGAACSFLAAAAVGGGLLPVEATQSAYAAGVAMAVVGTALAIAAFLAGMARVGSAWASIASSFEPVFTVALGVAVLGDRLGPGKVAGGLAVVAGGVLLPLLRGSRETVGSTAQGADAFVDGVSSPMVSSNTKNAPTRGSTRR